MREKKWKDCPACGAKDSMHYKSGITEQLKLAGYPPLEINDLDGQFCTSCEEGFWSMNSEKQISHSLARHRAECDSKTVVAAELASVKEAAATLHLSAQGIHKMMDEGRLRYVLAGGLKLPIRKDLARQAQTRQRAVHRHA